MAAYRSAPGSDERKEERPSPHRVNCVLLSCFDDDAHFLASILALTAIRLHRADTLEQADFLITVTGATVLVSETSFLDGSWEHAAAMLRERHPLVASLIIADPAERQNLSRASECVLGICWKPVQARELGAAIRTAHTATLDRMAAFHANQNLPRAVAAEPNQ